jgi:hypothetical protein
MGVTPEVRLAFDRAMAAFEAEMEAEGRHNWREELRAAAPPTITPIMTEDPGQVDGEDAEDDEGGQHFDEVEQAWQEVRNETLRATLGTDDARTMELRQQVDSLCGSISHMVPYHSRLTHSGSISRFHITHGRLQNSEAHSREGHEPWTTRP